MSQEAQPKDHTGRPWTETLDKVQAGWHTGAVAVHIQAAAEEGREIERDAEDEKRGDAAGAAVGTAH